MSRKQVAALVGVAPYAFDTTASGNDSNEAIAPPSPAMNSRRLICNPQGSQLA
jgi:hypothetical protein